MKIKRYFAPDMRQAIRKVREEQGPDAVILSNRRVDGGIELVAAVDYDEMLARASALACDAGGPAANPGRTEAADSSADGSDGVDVVPLPREPAPAAPELARMHGELRALRSWLETQMAQFAWSDLCRAHPLRAGLLRRLVELGLTPTLARDIAQQAAPAQDEDQAWRHALHLLGQRLPATDDDILNRGGVVALVGATGVGKTTTVAKLAARFALRHGQREVALVSTDSFRIGAHEQLMTYGRILGVPVHVAADRAELAAVLHVQDERRLVLIDTAGMSQRDLRLAEQLATLRGESPHVRTYLVLSATAQCSGLDEVVRSFGRIELSGCILTKIDEAGSLGPVLSATISHHLPIAYVADGQRVPEDMHPARPAALVSRAVTLMEERAELPAEELLVTAFGGQAHAQL